MEKKLPELVTALMPSEDVRGRRVRVMFQDEARFGRMVRIRRCWAPSPAEVMEGRGIATGKAFDAPACRTQSRVSASMGFDGLRDRAKQQRRENMHIVASSPAARAVCGNPARSDLCGGRRVTVVPAANRL